MVKWNYKLSREAEMVTVMLSFIFLGFLFYFVSSSPEERRAAAQVAQERQAQMMENYYKQLEVEEAMSKTNTPTKDRNLEDIHDAVMIYSLWKVLK